MAPDVIEISSGDDEPPAPVAQKPPNGQPGTASSKKSAVDSTRREASTTRLQSSRNGFGKHSNPSPLPSNGNAANHGKSLAGSSASTPKIPTTRLLGATSRNSQHGSVNSSRAAKASNQRSQKQPLDVINLDSSDDDSLPALPDARDLVEPRSNGANGSAKSQNRVTSPSTSWESSKHPRKRTLESDSFSAASSSTNKRQKLDHSDDRSKRELASSKQKTSSGNANTQADKSEKISNKVSQSDARDTISPRRMRLASPSKDRVREPASELNGNDGATSTQRNKSQAANIATNGKQTTPISLLKPSRDRQLPSKPDESSQPSAPILQGRLRSSSPESRTSAARQALVTLRKQRAAGGDSSRTTNDDKSPQPTTRQPSNREAEEKEKAELSNARSPAGNKRDEVPSASQRQTPDHSAPLSSGREPDQGGVTSAEGLDTQRQVVDEHQDFDTASNAVDSPSTPNGATANSAGKLPRKLSSEEDQGYASLSSSNADVSQVGTSSFQSVDLTEQPLQAKPGDACQCETCMISPTGRTRRECLNQKLQRGILGMAPSEAKRIFQERFVSVVYDTSSKDRLSANNLHEAATDAGINAKEPISREVRQHDGTNHSQEADSQLRREELQGAEQNQVLAESENANGIAVRSASTPSIPLAQPNLPLTMQVEKVLGRYFEELRGDNEYWTSVSMKRARLSKEDECDVVLSPASAKHSPGELTSFANLQPLKLLPDRPSNSSSKPNMFWMIQKMTGGTGAALKMSAPCEFFSSDELDVPNYAHYVSIKNNILAPNVIRLHCWPYFGEDFVESDAVSLREQYKFDIYPRERKLKLLLKAQKYEEYVELALADVNCSWPDVFRFLLEDNPDVGSDPAAKAALQNRPKFCDEDFSRTSDRSIALLSALPPSSPDKLGRAALLCETFQRMANFSLWHVARRSESSVLPEKSDVPDKVHPANNELTCRVCLRFNCPYHGEFKHYADGSEDEEEENIFDDVESVVVTDIVNPLRVNYRSRVAFPPSSEDSSMSFDDRLVSKEQKQSAYWNSGQYKHKAEERGPFYPCHHPGHSCEDARCSCFEAKIPCEKICSCPRNCLRKFSGCSCDKSKKGQKVCFENDHCACWQSGRECDPDLCGACGVCDVVDPMNKYDDEVLAGRCRNASIQRAVPKHTILGDSGVHGLGLYACEEIKQNEFVGEYKGEIITKKEADRRGAVYIHQKLSFLFSLNKTQEIDSTYFGNKVRFINHAGGSRSNLYPRIIMVNAVHRIALYAERHIHAGQELLFDYGPKFPGEQLQEGKKQKKSAPHVRNANLVRDEFWDVEESEDEVGNRRAKAVQRKAISRTAGTKSRTKAGKPRGATRAGATRIPQTQQQTHAGEKSTDIVAEADHGQGAAERLAAFNISDELQSDLMEVDGSEEDEAFEPEASEPEASEPEESEQSEESERSESEGEDRELGQMRGTRRRGEIRARMRRQ